MDEKQDKQLSENQKNDPDEKRPDNLGVNKNRRFYNRRRRYSSQQYQYKKESVTFKKISIVIPLLNEEESLNLISHEIRKVIKPIDVGFEVIFIDDGSTDNSLNVIKEICRTDKRFKYISFKKNYGKSAALQVGFKYVTGDAIITMDADLQDDPSEIFNLLKKLDEGYDMVSGWKKIRKDPLVKKFSSRFFNFVTRVISKIKIHDFNCGLKAYRREVVDNIYIYMVSFIATYQY